MLRKTITKFKFLGKVNLYRTLRLRRNTTGKCYILKNTVVNIAPSARITVKQGSLTINNKWTPNDPFPTDFSMGENARLLVGNSFHIYSGARIYLDNNATLSLGSGYINNNATINCFESIKIGNSVAIGNNVCIRDSDNHRIVSNEHGKTGPIVIGDHVWIGMNVTILKGVTIGNGAIIAANSLVNKDVPDHTLAGGTPAKVLKSNVEWE